VGIADLSRHHLLPADPRAASTRRHRRCSAG